MPTLDPRAVPEHEIVKANSNLLIRLMVDPIEKENRVVVRKLLCHEPIHPAEDRSVKTGEMVLLNAHERQKAVLNYCERHYAILF